MDVEERASGQGEEEPRERWFWKENTRAEIRILARMEDDLNFVLLFEHGGSQWESQLWITRILLNKLSQERKTLGKVVEVFAKLQRRDIMHNMVKLHDLVDLAELPWQNLVESSTSERSQDEVTAWDVEMDGLGRRASPGETNLGLG